MKKRAKLYETAIRQGVEEADAYFMLGKSLGTVRATENWHCLIYNVLRNWHHMIFEIRLSYGIVLANMELFTEAADEFRFHYRARCRQCGCPL